MLSSDKQPNSRIEQVLTQTMGSQLSAEIHQSRWKVEKVNSQCGHCLIGTAHQPHFWSVLFKQYNEGMERTGMPFDSPFPVRISNRDAALILENETTWLNKNTKISAWQQHHATKRVIIEWLTKGIKWKSDQLVSAPD